MYEVRVTRQFMRAVRKVDSTALTRARDEILASPYDAHGSHALRHDWSGFRSVEFDDRNRIIYRVCEECRKLQQTQLHPLQCCAEPDANPLMVTFVDFGDYHASAGRRRLFPARYYEAETSED